MMKKVAVIILNFKIKDQTLLCINSVKKSSYKNLEIIVVDNDSKDQIEDDLKKNPLVTFIQTGENLGYAGGNNIGIKKALENKADYVFILNPDTKVKVDAIEILIERAEKNNAQIVCPKIYFAGSKIIWFAGKKFDLANVLASHIGVDEEDKGQYDQDKEIEDVTGAAMLVSKEVFEGIGLFDERYFLYYEESDFAFRAKENKFKFMYIHEAVVFHKNAQSTGLGSPLQDYFITRNRMLFASKFLPFRTQFALIREGIRNIRNPMRRLALFDFLMGKFGKGSLKI